MARFLSTALRPLGSIFGLKGSVQSTDDLDLASVQLTGDVMDAIAFGRGVGSQGGWALFFSSHLHNAATTITDTATPYLGATVPTGSFQNGFARVDAAEFMLWVMDAGVQHVNGTLGGSFHARLKVDQDVAAIGPQGGPIGGPAAIWLFAGSTRSISPTVPQLPTPVLNDITRPSFAPFPIIGPNAILSFISQSEIVGAPTVQGWILCRVIPRGLRP